MGQGVYLCDTCCIFILTSEQANYVAAELQNPAKQLPLAINTAVPLAAACYVLTNAAYYILVPWKVVGTTDAIAVTAMSRLFGKPGALTMAALIIAVVAGAMNGNIFVIGRLIVAAAHKGYLPAAFGYIGHMREASRPAADAADGQASRPRFNAPLNAYLLGFALTSLYILTCPFRFLLTYDGIAEYSFFFLAVLGALVLRVREPRLHRPYRPVVLAPAVFVLVCGGVVVRGAIFEPWKAGIFLVVLAVGLIGYWGAALLRRRRE